MRIESYYDERTGDVKIGKIFFTFVGFVIVIALVFGTLGLVGGWFKAGKDIISADNVKEQNFQIIQNWESAQASALNACSAQRGAATGANDPTLVEDPALAYAAVYRKVVADYNRRQANLFEARVAGPPSYPDSIPSYDTGPDTDWCDVARQLDELR